MMKVCHCLLVWLNDDNGVAFEACGDDESFNDHREMVFSGNDSLPLEQLEICLLRAVKKLQHKGWLIAPWTIEGGMANLRRFWNNLHRFDDYVQERRTRVPVLAGPCPLREWEQTRGKAVLERASRDGGLVERFHADRVEKRL